MSRDNRFKENDRRGRSFPFLKGYEKLLWDHKLKLDIFEGKLVIVDLGNAPEKRPSTYIYLAKLTEMVENDDIISRDKHRKRMP